MKLVVGLGNPGLEYVATRHNAGFRVADELAKQLDISFQYAPKMFSEVAKNTEYVVVKPQTFMNDSGKAVQAVLHFFKLSWEDLVVVHDDLDIPFGSYKIQQGTGPKTHNGLTSIYLSLGTRDFTHVRIGVDNRQGGKTMPPKNYVLQPFLKEEEPVLKTVVENIAAQLQQ